MTEAALVRRKILNRSVLFSRLGEREAEGMLARATIARYAEGERIFAKGDPGDSMFFILEGELRVRIEVMGKETILTTLGTGEFFGDISLFDHGPRSADVVANADSVVARISARSFDELAAQAPDLATPFLRALGKTLTARIRADNKRYGDSVKFARASA